MGCSPSRYGKVVHFLHNHPRSGLVPPAAKSHRSDATGRVQGNRISKGSLHNSWLPGVLWLPLPSYVAQRNFSQGGSPKLAGPLQQVLTPRPTTPLRNPAHSPTVPGLGAPGSSDILSGGGWGRQVPKSRGALDFDPPSVPLDSSPLVFRDFVFDFWKQQNHRCQYCGTKRSVEVPRIAT